MNLDSANSGSKSKRNLNPIPSGTSKINSKRRKTNQKTLGVAWGAANSHSPSSRSSPFSDFGSYMVVKNQKLHEQFDAEASTSSHHNLVSGKPIFHGVSIFVDGFTVPSSQELRGYMLKHGGRFENYFSRHRVSHVVCSNLPDSKLKNLRSFSAGLPVVKPTWVLDSVAANKLLSWHTYQLDQLAPETRSQPKLSAFFPLKRSPFPFNHATNAMGQPMFKTENPALEIDTMVSKNSFGEGESIEEIKHYDEESDIPSNANLAGAKDEERSCIDVKFCEPNTSKAGDGTLRGTLTGEGESIEETKCYNKEADILPHLSFTMAENKETENDDVKHCEPNTSEPGLATSENILAVVGHEISSPGRPSTHFLDKEQSSESSNSKIATTSNHSTLVDPNFVENYFKNSRLHFIGTWRNRYRRRFPNISTGVKCINSGLNATDEKTVIVHVDMDCFFVSVVIRNHPELQNKPVAVCHSDNPRGTAEISSANYPARVHGVRAGIFVRDAKSMCPDLLIVPYNFEAYEEVADQFYEILHKHCNKVQAVSCDEAFLDVTDSKVEDHQLLASIIRKEIFDITGCKASAGIARNMLMARLATRTAKPDGQCYIAADKVEEYLNELPIKALPGIGHVLEEKLKSREVKTCRHLRLISKESLQKDFGLKTGDMLWKYSRGIDNRLVGVIQESKSIGAEVNWGVRFNNFGDCQHFLVNLCKEVSLRLQGCGCQGRTFTLKVKKRKNDAMEPVKYMGCGDCENLSHSTTVPMATDDVDVLQRVVMKLFGSFYIDVKEIRGMGLQVSKLESAESGNQGHERNSIRSWLASVPRSNRDRDEAYCKMDLKNRNYDGNTRQLCTNLSAGGNFTSSEDLVNQDSTLPPLCDLDIGVIESLPPELFLEINNLYGGKLITLVSKHKAELAESNTDGICPRSSGGGCGMTSQGVSSLVPSTQCIVDRKSTVEKVHAAPVSAVVASTINPPFSEHISVMPSSLSQVDVSVLQQLPEEMRVKILELLPSHKGQECISDWGPHKFCPQQSFDSENTDNQPGSTDTFSASEFWLGNPPGWVGKFKSSSSLVLNIFADNYYNTGSTGRLSSILQRAISDSRFSLGSIPDGWDDAILCLSNLFKQYIKLKIETDIEEIYLCFRLLRRLSTKSTFFLEAYSFVLPEIQETVGEKYGGSFNG